MNVKKHYNPLIDENNDPFNDAEELKDYMDTWDGKPFIDELKLTKRGCGYFLD